MVMATLGSFGLSRSLIRRELRFVTKVRRFSNILSVDFDKADKAEAIQPSDNLNDYGSF